MLFSDEEAEQDSDRSETEEDAEPELHQPSEVIQPVRFLVDLSVNIKNFRDLYKMPSMEALKLRIISFYLPNLLFKKL